VPTLECRVSRRAGPPHTCAANRLHRYIGPAEASRGFRKAFLVLAKNPASAKAALSATNPMQPLHLLLALDAPVSSAVGTKDKAKQGALARAKNASQEAASAAAIPLIVAVCAASPESAQVSAGEHTLPSLPFLLVGK